MSKTAEPAPVLILPSDKGRTSVVCCTSAYQVSVSCAGWEGHGGPHRMFAFQFVPHISDGQGPPASPPSGSVSPSSSPARGSTRSS
eukprot:8787912-Alexandrium_andersonii.AAC.1